MSEVAIVITNKYMAPYMPSALDTSRAVDHIMRRLQAIFLLDDSVLTLEQTLFSTKDLTLMLAGLNSDPTKNYALVIYIAQVGRDSKEN